MKRITWLIGPPGAGKSTFAKHGSHRYDRIIEFNEILFSIIKNTCINQGILSANNQLVKLIRDIELRPENISEKPVLVVAGILNAEVLYPVSHLEDVWLILPEKQLWKKQFEMRPVDSDSAKLYYENYNDFSWSERWYDEFATWTEKSLPLKKLEIKHDISLLGRRHYE